MTRMTALAKRRADFHAEADRRYAKFLTTGESIPWEEMRRYLLDRIHGNPTLPPRARKFST